MTTRVQSSCVVRGAERPGAVGTGLRARDGTVGGAALDVEHVGEVGADLELEVHAGRQRVRVAQGQLLHEAAGEPAAAHQQELGDLVALRLAGRGRPDLPAPLDGDQGAGDGDGGQRGRRGRAQQLDPADVDGHPEPAQVPDVVVHQTVRRGDHVTRLGADGEAAAVDDDEVVAPAGRDAACREMVLRHPSTVHNEPGGCTSRGHLRCAFGARGG